MRTALAVALAVASSSAAALGLGQIELKSKLGEPLLAEILIISSDPSELEHLRAGLASPETFARVGLASPQGALAQLRFTPAIDSAGRPVIRVTSDTAISEPLLTFLIEVDWGQGRLVREYSTLLDAPRTVAAPLQPPIDGPRVVPSNTIVRQPSLSKASPAADASAETPRDASDRSQDRDDQPPAAVREKPVPAASVAAGMVGRPDRYGAVKSGESLSTIAGKLGTRGNLNQTMIALLQANPEAFIDGNIHLLKQGAVLRVPDAAAVSGIGAAQAMAQVREQTRAWRAARQPVPQPQLAGGDEVPAIATTATTGNDSARLEIVPPGASDASRAGTQSGISAGGEGDMVRQELQTTKETLAARDAELAEMKSRIEALEQLQADQQKLISMKDSELTAAQQQLAQTQAADTSQPASGMPWLLGGGGLVLVLLGGWWLRRRADMGPKFRAPPPSQPGRASALAAGFPQASQSDAERSDTGQLDPEASGAVSSVAASPAEADVLASPTPFASGESDDHSASRTAPDVGQVAVPAWHATSGKNKLNRSGSVPVTPVETTLATATSVGIAPGVEEVEFETDAPGLERLELARAYLDLGDQDSARQLLGELVSGGSPSAREQAAQLLRDIG
ncbi:MAG: FimV/HubP family polar landmark protein [Lysobacter sp.]